MTDRVYVGEIEGIVTSSRDREFDGKQNGRHYKLTETEFFCLAKNFSGIIRDWDMTLKAESLKPGTKILVKFYRVQPVRGMASLFEFTGVPVIVK